MEQSEWLRAVVVVCCLFAVSSGKGELPSEIFVFLSRVLILYDEIDDLEVECFELFGCGKGDSHCSWLVEALLNG